jgi:hypothetical protein
MQLSKEQIDYLLSPAAIRDQAKVIFDRTVGGQGLFQYHPEKLKWTTDYVLSTIKKNYPDLNIPFHSRWGHFRAGKIDRVKDLDRQLEKFDRMERSRIKLDLVITSVLLDAGAGADWKYIEKSTGKTLNRSEGLGIASLSLFLSGTMSQDRKNLRADANGLKELSNEDIIKYFQVSDSNPLVGIDGRRLLLNNLAVALENKNIFKDSRPGNIIDYLIEKFGKTIPAEGLLRAVLDGFGPIWPGRLNFGKVNLGDVWVHTGLDKGNLISTLVPFHKLSQWMTYSLIEPIEEAGCKVTGVDQLTGLAEYRNGGLMVDAGLISLKDSKMYSEKWPPESALVIEWRALTIYLLDQIGRDVQMALGKTSDVFPLAKVLEGGTWWAGRFLANEKRVNGDPPIQIKSDGTVF